MNARMPWPLVEAFLVLTEELQLGRAADRLGVSRQTLSRRIDLLEAELGGRLVQRSTRRITLTRAGVVLRDRGTVVARMMDDLAWHTRLATDAHTLSVGISTDVTAPWATQVAVWVEARGTRAVLERRSVGSVVALVRESRLDLALVVGDVVDEPHSDVVGYETCVVVFPDTHPAAGRNAIRVGDLRGLVVAVSDVGRPEHHGATV